MSNEIEFKTTLELPTEEDLEAKGAQKAIASQVQNDFGMSGKEIR